MISEPNKQVLEASPNSAMGGAPGASSSSISFISGPVSYSYPLSVRLDNDNFLLWRKLVVSMIQGHNLQHFVLGSRSPPVKFLSIEVETCAKDINMTSRTRTRSQNGIFRPKVYAASLEPALVEEAVQQEQWKSTMNDEFSALMRNGTWSLVQLLEGRKALVCKWVFKVKENHDGTIDKYKAHLVAKGFHQVAGFDFNEIFSFSQWRSPRGSLHGTTKRIYCRIIYRKLGVY